MTYPLVSIDPYKRTKIFYAAGFVVSGMTLMFFVFSSKTMSLGAANVLMIMSLLFFALGAFLYWRAGRIFRAGEMDLDDQIINIRNAGAEQQLYNSELREILLKDEGFQKFEHSRGKIFSCTIVSKDGFYKQRFQIFFVSEESLRAFLAPIKAAGIAIVQSN